MSLPSLVALNPSAVGAHELRHEWHYEPEGAQVTIDPSKDYDTHARVWIAMQLTYNRCWASNPASTITSSRATWSGPSTS